VKNLADNALFSESGGRFNPCKEQKNQAMVNFFIHSKKPSGHFFSGTKKIW
jgi:hypothetical protein